MPLPKHQAWFPAKTDGWGWGLPGRWQGWLVMLAFIVALAAGAPLAKRAPAIFLGYSLGIAAGLVVICCWKGEKPHWSWKKSQ